MTKTAHEKPIIDSSLDRRFQNMVLPFMCMKHLFFKSSFAVEHKCIRPHRRTYYIASLIGTLVFIIFHSFNYLNLENFRYYSPFLLYFSHFNRLLLLISFIVFYCINIYQRKNNVLLILKIQEAFRIIHYKNYEMYTIWNWICILLEFIVVFILVAISVNVRNAFFFISLIYFDVDITYGIRVISLIRDGMIAWIAKVEYYSELSLEPEGGQYDDNFKELFQAYTVLLEAFDIFKRIFQYSILFQTVVTFLHSLQFLEITLEFENYLAENRFSLFIIPLQIVTSAWILRNMILTSMFSVNCEKFYMAVCDANATCSRLLKNSPRTVVSKRLCKNMLRLNLATFHKMTACRMITVDGRLPQEFGYLVMEYLVMLLQFALLIWARQK